MLTQIFPFLDLRSNVRKPDAATDVGFGDPLPIRWTSAGVYS